MPATSSESEKVRWVRVSQRESRLAPITWPKVPQARIEGKSRAPSGRFCRASEVAMEKSGTVSIMDAAKTATKGRKEWKRPTRRRIRPAPALRIASSFSDAIQRSAAWPTNIGAIMVAMGTVASAMAIWSSLKPSPFR